MNRPGFIIIGVNKVYFRPILEKHGLWDQAQEDNGFEFNLVCFVEDMMRDFTCNKTRQPWIKIKSLHLSSTYFTLVTFD